MKRIEHSYHPDPETHQAHIIDPNGDKRLLVTLYFDKIKKKWSVTSCPHRTTAKHSEKFEEHQFGYAYQEYYKRILNHLIYCSPPFFPPMEENNEQTYANS